jgi:hypothetical protein
MSGMVTSRERTFIAGADLSSSQYRYVKLHSTQNQVVVATAGTDKIIGVLLNAPKSGWEARVGLLNGAGTYQIVASAAIALGAYVTATTGGKAVTTTTAGNVVAGEALEAAGADGDLIEILPTNFHHKV